MAKSATFRFYEELNDFLPPARKKVPFPYEFRGNPSIKDAIEAIGVPHTEVDLILANGESVAFSYHLRNGDRISVYPVFESLDISPVIHLRAAPLRKPKFVLDTHLGKLAKYLRLLGFDTLYEHDYEDAQIIAISVAEKRAILTGDIGILKNNAVTHGQWIRSSNAREQVCEVLERFDLSSCMKPFTRCTVCNGMIRPVPKETVADRLEPRTLHCYDEFYRCASCGKVYWKGSHYQRMKDFVAALHDRYRQ